jgi:phosphatidylserine decarboxylase
MTAPTSSKLDKLKILPQHILSYRPLSKLMYYATRQPMGKATTWLIQQFVKRYQVDMDSAEIPEIEQYGTFNEFFTRALRPDARPIAPEGIVSPVDGTISQIGKLEKNTLLEAKGFACDLNKLFGGYDSLTRLFENGIFCAFYLSPTDYHRVHMPVAGRPIDVVYVPGRLYSVNPKVVQHIPNVFSRNERVISLFRSEAGPMAMAMVGATFVGSIETVWEGQITPSEFKKPQHWQTADNTETIKRGGEMGRFNMGSSVILLMDSSRAAWLPELQEGSKVKMGQAIGKMLVKPGPARPALKPTVKPGAKPALKK